jgi:hypothetical protein
MGKSQTSVFLDFTVEDAWFPIISPSSALTSQKTQCINYKNCFFSLSSYSIELSAILLETQGLQQQNELRHGHNGGEGSSLEETLTNRLATCL